MPKQQTQRKLPAETRCAYKTRYNKRNHTKEGRGGGAYVFDHLHLRAMAVGAHDGLWFQHVAATPILPGLRGDDHGEHLEAQPGGRHVGLTQQIK